MKLTQIKGTPTPVDWQHAAKHHLRRVVCCRLDLREIIRTPTQPKEGFRGHVATKDGQLNKATFKLFMCHNDEEPGRGHRRHNSADRLAIAVCRERQPQDAGQDNRQLIKYFQKLQLKNVEVAEKGLCVICWRIQPYSP